MWESFFRGEEIDFLFEDITCTVASQDALGLELAKSLQSRLPENQMTVKREDAILVLSKIDYGRYDVILFSREFYERCNMDDAAFNGEDDLIEAEGV